MSTGYTSDELSHFVGFRHPLDHEANYDLLMTVLRSGFVSHEPHEAGPGTISYTVDLDQSLMNEKLIVPTVTSYCDIPADKLALHVSKYGLFGLAFPRDLLIAYGARPVTYIPFAKTDRGSPHGQVMLRDIESIYRSFVKHLADEIGDKANEPRSLGQLCSTREGTIRALKSLLEKDFLAFVKPFDADTPPETFENYYLEREWRKYGNMKADETTIQRVFVAEGFEDRFRRDAPPLLADRVEGLPMTSADAKTRCIKCQQPLPTDVNLPCPNCGETRKRHTEISVSAANATSPID